MFTALVGSRALIHLVWGRRRKLERPCRSEERTPWNSSRRKPTIRFMGTRRRWSYTVSGDPDRRRRCCSLAFRGLNFGIDFTGGVVLELAFPEAADIDQVRGGARRGRVSATRRCRASARRATCMVRAAAGGGRGYQPGRARACSPRSRRYEPNVELRRTEVGRPAGRRRARRTRARSRSLFTFVCILVYVALRFQWKLGVGADRRGAARPDRDPRILLRDPDDLRPAGAGRDPRGDRLLAERHRRRVRPDPRALPVVAQGHARRRSSTRRSTRRCRARS